MLKIQNQGFQYFIQFKLVLLNLYCIYNHVMGTSEQPVIVWYLCSVVPMQHHLKHM